MKHYPCILVLLTCVTMFSQTGPGGIGSNDGLSNLEFWFDAHKDVFKDAGTTLASDNETVQQWNDQSGNSSNASQATAVKKPTYKTTSLNGYPVLDFDGLLNSNGDIMSLTNPSAATAIASVFIVAEGTYHGSYANQILNGNRIVFEQKNTDFKGRYYDGSTSGLVLTTIADGVPFIACYNFVAGGSSELFHMGTTAGTASTDAYISTTGDFNIGNHGTAARNWEGGIAEVMYFNVNVNTAERIIIENYLAAKYGQVLSSNDLYDGDDSGSGNYDHHVAGIGQALDGTNHNDSQGTGAVRIKNPTSLSNGDYLFWGENVKDANYGFTTETTTYYEEIGTQWRVSKVGDLGNVDIEFDLTKIDTTGKQSCQPLKLFVANNAAFTGATTYDLTIAGNIASASNIIFVDDDYFVLRYIDQIVWDGTSYYNGSGTGSAPADTDNCLKLTIKSGGTDGVLSSDAHVREVEIENGAILDINDAILLEVENQIDLNGVISLLGEAQLIQNHAITTANTGTGSLNVKQQGTSNLYNYNFWSSPVNVSGSWRLDKLEDTNGLVNWTSNLDGSPTTPVTLSSYWLYTYSAVSGENSGWESLSTNASITQGRGYTMKGSGAVSSDQEYKFKGIPNDGNYTYSVDAGNDFLIGNPYPSALDADQFINDNSGVIDGTLYFWEHFTTNNSHTLKDYEGGYATYNLLMAVQATADSSSGTSGNGTASNAEPTGKIPIGQGFFVTVENNGNLVFNNQQRVFAKESDGSAIYYGIENPENRSSTSNDLDLRTKVWFKLERQNNKKKIIGLGYDPKASYGIDFGFDSKIYNDDPHEMYWILQDDKWVIQGLPTFSINDELSLGMKVSDLATYKIGIEKMNNFPEEISIYLKDNKDNIYYDLKEGDARISLNSGIHHDRFSIVFQEEENANLDLNSESLDDFSIYHSNGVLYVKGISSNSIYKLSLYSLLGQEIFTFKDINKIRNSVEVPSLSSGIYLVKLTEDKNNKMRQFIKKIMVKL